ncbi:MAG TPA: O-antigen ligase family protein [Usitatibacter sp.]|nr:O-antigen ligase family protein [Usitatibacter sp.]
MSATPASFAITSGSMTPMKWGIVAAFVLLGIAWGIFVAFQAISAALVCLAAIVFVFTVRDFRVGVLVMILIMPISSSYMFPRAMFGVTGLNPLNVLLVGTFLSYLLVAMPDRSFMRLMPWWVAATLIAPLVLGGINGMGHVNLIAPFFFDNDLIEYKNAFGYMRDLVVKPLILVAYAMMVGAAYARAREPEKFLVPMMVSMWLMALLVIGFFLNSGVRFGELASEYARHFLSPLGMHANDLGRLYVTAVAILLFTWDRTRRPVLKTLLFLSMGLAGAALILTFSRNAFLTLALVFAIFLVSRRRNKKLMLLAAAGIPFVLLLMPGAIWYRLDMGAADGGDVSAGRTSDIWAPLLPDLFDKPFFGHGVQSILWTPAMRLGEMLQVTHPHNAYIGALLDFGVVGTILLLGFWFTVWKGFRELAKAPDLQPQEQGFFEGCAVALVSFIVAGFVGSSLTPVAEQSFLWLGIGLMFGVHARRARAEATRPAPPVEVLPRRSRESMGTRI